MRIDPRKMAWQMIPIVNQDIASGVGIYYDPSTNRVYIKINGIAVASFDAAGVIRTLDEIRETTDP